MKAIEPDWRGLDACLRRRGTPQRVHFIELFLDREIQDAILRRFDLIEGLSSDDPFFEPKRLLRVQRFLGYDYVRCGLDGLTFELPGHNAADTAGLPHARGRRFVDNRKGPITTWEEFERYPWPDPDQAQTTTLEWYAANLPENMCVIGGGGFSHFAEYLTWLMGYETLCFTLYDQRDLVTAISRRLQDIFDRAALRMLEYECVRMLWGSDDMGFRTGTLIAPDDLRAFVLPGHRRIAARAHAAGRLYLLHSCGNLEAIMSDLIDNVRIDAKHSFEDAIEDVCTAKQCYGDRIALLGGIDMDFLCRADPAAVRARVRATLDACLPGGGYCLGSGNSIANYVPLENYLAMLEEGRAYRLPNA